MSASRVFPLVTIHRERVDPEVCWIGRVVSVRNGSLSLLEIGPGAIWEEKITKYRTNEITRVDFGGDYEQALYLVGGPPSEPGHGAEGAKYAPRLRLQPLGGA